MEIDIFLNYRHPSLISPATNKSIELDVWIPEYKLAFEYQGEHHYHQGGVYGSGNKSKIQTTQVRMDYIYLIYLSFLSIRLEYHNLSNIVIQSILYVS